MSGKVTFIVPGEPVPKGRPRFSRAGHVYTPKKTRDYEKLVAFYAKTKIKQPYECPVKVSIVFQEQPPKSWSKTRKEKALNGEIAWRGRKDIDNLIKSILDGLNKVAYTDDNLVIKLKAKKEYGEQPMAMVTIEPMEELDG